MTKLLAMLVLFTGTALAQTSVTLPSQTVVTPITINGTKVNITITIPSQSITVPSGGGSTGLPSGLTWTNGNLNVAGTITATQITLTGGTTMPTNCANGLYLLQLVSGALQPVCYVPPATPNIAVSQVVSPINTVTLSNQ